MDRGLRFHLVPTAYKHSEGGGDITSPSDLLAAFAAWKKTYADLAAGFGVGQARSDWGPLEHEMLGVIELEKLLAVERRTVEKG